MQPSSVRLAGFAGVAGGVLGLLYLVAFLITRNPSGPSPSVLLMAGGIVGSLFVTGLYQRVQAVDHGLALWGWILAVAGAGGAAIHGAFDLANVLNPPGAQYAYPNPVDPRGFLTFGLAGLGTIVLSLLLWRGRLLSPAAGIVGMVSGALMVALYVAYLTILDATNLLVVALVFAAGVIQPLWTLWVGALLAREAGG